MNSVHAKLQDDPV